MLQPNLFFVKHLAATLNQAYIVAFYGNFLLQGAESQMTYASRSLPLVIPRAFQRKSGVDFIKSRL